MKKLIITAAALAALTGAGFTLAATAAPGDGDKSGAAMHAMADTGFMMDARIAGMKAALKLTPDQEKMWPALELAVRDAEKMRMEAMHERHEERAKEGRPSPIERLDEMSQNLAKASEELKKVADAAKPLYDGLDDTQKRHFGPLLMSLRGPGPMGRHGEGMHGDEMHGEAMHGPGESRDDGEL